MRERLRRSIAARQGEVVLRRDLRNLGSVSQVSRGLRQLVADGKLVRIGMGVYAKATPSHLSGQPAPRQTLDVLAAETLDRLGIEWRQGKAQRLYNAGRTTQVPWRITFDTSPRRITRRLQVGKGVVEYGLPSGARGV
ncbi:MAG: S-adenosylhomocysteine hydrolase [Synechococcus sp. SB0677_bin_5]|nr:S-adenosylhomocysteine hydrolase [Synechococcus sp. SB0677_bin_5]